MIRLVLLAMVCCSCDRSSEVWLDGYERGATITKRVGEFFSFGVEKKVSTGTQLYQTRIFIMDSDGNEIDYAIMSWDNPILINFTTEIYHQERS